VWLEFEGVAMKTRALLQRQLARRNTPECSAGSILISRHTFKKGANFIAVFVSMEKIPASVLPMGEAVTVNLTASKVRSLRKGCSGRSLPGSTIAATICTASGSPSGSSFGTRRKLMTFGSRRHWMALMYRLRPVQPREAKRELLNAKWTDLKTRKVLR